jgi:hypothetical protein
MGLAGIELDPGDIDLIRRIHDLLRAMVEPFEGLDLSVHPAEIGLDPGRPPSDG